MNPEELNQLQAAEQARQEALEERIYCCTAAGCLSCGADAVRNAIAAVIKSTGRTEQAEVCGTGCLGMCSHGPLVLAASGRALYGKLTPADAPALASADPNDRPSLADRR